MIALCQSTPAIRPQLLRGGSRWYSVLAGTSQMRRWREQPDPSRDDRGRRPALGASCRRLRRARDLALGTHACVRQPRLALAVVRLRLTLPHSLRRQPLDQLLRSLRAPRPTSPWDEGCIATITELLLRPPSPLRTSCLFRALVRFALLAAHDPSIRFVVGLRAAAAGGGGHAWLDRGGVPLFGDSTQQCVATFTYPP